MNEPHLSQVEAYWESLRGDRPAPLRSEIDPRGIAEALEFAFVVERIAPGIARFRLAGMHLSDLMGMEVRGMPLTSFFAPDAGEEVGTTLGHVFEQPAKAVHHLRGRDASGAVTMTGQMLLLPLRSDLGDISRALGCLVTDGEPGRAPHRFEIVRTDIWSLAGPRGDFDVRPARRVPLTEGFAEKSSGYASDGDLEGDAATPRGTPSRPHLRLVHDTDRDE